MDIKIKPTVESDVTELCSIQKAAFLPLYEKYHDEGNPYLRGSEDITKRLNSECFRYFTIWRNYDIVGGVLYKSKGSTPFHDHLDMGHYYLQRIYIKPDLQCNGIAQIAISLCEKEFSDAECFWVDFPNDLEKNKRCYTKVGFCDTGKRLQIQPDLILACYKKDLSK